jgi:hypothetical protein
MTSAAEGTGALEPELLRLLLKLAEAGTVLRRVRTGGEPHDMFEMIREGQPAPGAASPQIKVPASLVERLHRLDLLETGGPEAFRLSPQGRAALRRALARNEPFREQHEERRVKRLTAHDPREVLLNEAESPLVWLRSRTGKDGQPLIGEAQFQAGERLRADFTRAGLEPRITAKWDGLASSRRERRGAGQQAQHLSDTALAARQRVENALAAAGPDFAPLLLDVCCFLMGLADAERRQGLPLRSGKVVLGLALNALARHYGLLPRDAPGRRMTLQHWGSPDYRPSLSRDD